MVLVGRNPIFKRYAVSTISKNGIANGGGSKINETIDLSRAPDTRLRSDTCWRHFLDKDDFDIRSIYPDFPENELGWHMVDGKLKQFVTTDGMTH
jgi:hypothetical protein